MHVHFTGACGRAIGSLAAELKQRPGWTISASDACQYSPMDQILKKAGLEISTSYKTSHIPKNAAAVVIGTSIADDNIEIAAARKKGIPILNMAQFLNQHVLKNGKRIVVAGTNGKTTVTTMLAWIFTHAKKQPDYLIGGNSPHFPSSVRFRNSQWTILEGDEYIASQNDLQPKFLYYKPDIALLTNLNYDHSEVFEDLNSIIQHFENFVSLLPENGNLIIPTDDAELRKIASNTSAEVMTVGRPHQSDYRITRCRPSSQGMTFDLNGQKIYLPLPGMMNVMNAAMACAAAEKAGIPFEQSAAALNEFHNAAGRLEILEDNVAGTFILDEAYHPAALRENIAALRLRFPNRPLTVALLPRFTGGNKGFQMAELPGVLAAADRVILAGVFDPTEFPSGPFSNRKLAARLKRKNVKAHVLKGIASLPRFMQRNWTPNDIVLCSLPPGHRFVYEPLIKWMNLQTN